MIEINTLTELTRSHVLPALESQIVETAQVSTHFTTGPAKKSHGVRMSEMEIVYGDIISHLGDVEKMNSEIESFEDVEKQMQWMVEKITPHVNQLREACDKAESIVSADMWRLPKYREMLFSNTLS